MTATPTSLGFALIQRAGLGGPTQQFDRKGARYRLTVTAGPFYADSVGRELVALLLSAKRGNGLRMRYPLQWTQGTPGLALVSGPQNGGKVLTVRNVTPSYVAMPGYFVSITNSEGRRYLHSIRDLAQASVGGLMTLTLNEELRHPFVDGNAVELAAPEIEGFVDGQEWSWELRGDRMTPINFTIEEYE